MEKETQNKAKESSGFEPKVVAFTCNWCSAGATDLAGSTQSKYPVNVRIHRMMCSGSLDPVYVYAALLRGADAVLVSGCPPGECHYVNGNYKMKRRLALLKKIMEIFDLGKERVWLQWLGASESNKFANSASKITEAAKKSGPNPLNRSWTI